MPQFATRWKEVLIAFLAVLSLSFACWALAARFEAENLIYLLDVQTERANQNFLDLLECRELLGGPDPEESGTAKKGRL